MKKDKRITGLYVITVLLIIGAFFLFGKAFLLGESGMDGEENFAGNITSEAEKDNPGVNLLSESISLDEFNAFFTGDGTVKMENAIIEGVPVNVFYADNQGALPLIIMQHGLDTNKDYLSELANSFAMQGYVVIVPDAVGYGELADGDLRSVSQILEGTAANFEKVIDFACQSEKIDENRIGLCGISLGGLTSLYYAAFGEHDVKVVVSFCATPDFATLEGAGSIRCYYTEHDMVKEKDQKKVDMMEESMISLSPYDKLMSKDDLSVFLMCGAEDQVVPPEGNVAFYQEAIAAGKNVSLVVKENQGHSLEADEMYAALAFMVENL